MACHLRFWLSYPSTKLVCFMKNVRLMISLLVLAPTVIGCSSSEPTVMAPDQDFYQQLENSPINVAEETSVDVKPKG